MANYLYNTMISLGNAFAGLATGNPATSIGYRRYNADGTLLAGETFNIAGVFEGTTPGSYYVNGGISLPAGFSGSIRWFVGNAATQSVGDEPIGTISSQLAPIIPGNTDPASLVTIYDVARLPNGTPVVGRQVIIKVLSAPDNLGNGLVEQSIPGIVSDATGLWSVALQRGSTAYFRIPEENVEVSFVVTSDPAITSQRLADAAAIV